MASHKKRRKQQKYLRPMSESKVPNVTEILVYWYHTRKIFPGFRFCIYSILSTDQNMPANKTCKTDDWTWGYKKYSVVIDEELPALVFLLETSKRYSLPLHSRRKHANKRKLFTQINVIWLISETNNKTLQTANTTLIRYIRD